MKIANADRQLPEWLLQDYKDIYEHDTNASIQQASSAPDQSINDTPSAELPEPDFGSFPQNSARTGW